MSRLARQPYSQYEKDHLVKWLATNHPEKRGLMGHRIWADLTNDQDARPWNANHTWQSWRDQYKHNESYYDNRIEKELKRKKNSSNSVHELSSGSDDENERQTKNRQPAVKQPKKKPVLVILSDESDEVEGESEEESAPNLRESIPVSSNANKVSRIRLLAEYYVQNDIAEDIRSRADTLQDLYHDDDCEFWAKQLRPIEWRAFYNVNRKAISEQVTALEQLGDQNRIRKRALKRRTVSDDEDASDVSDKRVTSHGQSPSKKRRLETLAEEAHSESGYEHAENRAPDEVRSTKPEQEPPTSEAPSSTTVTPPRKAAKRSRAVYATPESVIEDDGAGEDDKPSDVELHTIEFDRYGVPGSPSGTLPPGWQQQQHTPLSRSITPMNSQVNGLPRFDGRVPAVHAFPLLYPSLTLPPMGDDATPRAFEIPEEASQVSLTPIVPDPDIGVPETPMAPSLGGSFTSRMKGIVGKIFPTTLPSLTPLLREKRAHLSGMSTVSEEHITPQANAHPTTGAPEHDHYDFQDGQPSPMPYVGSEGRSTRSYSFSPNADDSARTAHNHQKYDQEETDAVEEEEVDELIDDELEEFPPPQPRFVPSRNFKRLDSESPLFASTASTPSDAPERRNMAAASRHYPVREKMTAAGLVRQRGQRPSQRVLIEDSDSVDDVGISQAQDGQDTASEDEDKENRPRETSLAPAVKRAAPVPRRSTLSVRYEDLGATFNQDTPEMHSPKKSLTLIGVTPPEPRITATSVRSNMRAGDRAPRNILKGYHTEKPASKSTAMNYEELSLKPRISLTSPNFGSDVGADLDANGDPSPLSRKGLQGDKAGAKVKVRFETAAANRGRRKTTGGIGARFDETSFPIASASVPRTTFHPPPAPKPMEKLVSESDPIDLDSDEAGDLYDDESPLAHYSQASRMATSSPNKSMRKSAPGSMTSRRSFGQQMHPPSPIPVPIVIHSRSPDPSPQKPVMRLKFGHPTAARPSRTQNMTEAAWSPIKFPQTRVDSIQPPAETLRSGREQNGGSTPGTSRSASTLTGMTLDYRDQRETAKWLQSTRGRPVIISRETDERQRRSAPLSEPRDVVYSSDSPRRVASRSRSRSRSTRDDGNIGELSKADCKRIVTHMISHGLIEPDAQFGSSEMFDGLAAYLIHLAREFNFQPQVAQEMWTACWDLEETEEHLARMFGAAKATADRGLDVDRSGVGNEELLERLKRQERRQRIARQSLGTARTRRVSDQLEKSVMLSEEDEEGSEDEADSERSHPPSSVPFGVLQPLLG